jgi:hypothetical protein
MVTIMLYVNLPRAVPPAPDLPPIVCHHNGICMMLNGITAFSGNNQSWDDWEQNQVATCGQTPQYYSVLVLGYPSLAGYGTAIAKNQEFFNMLKKSCMLKGHMSRIFNSVEDDNGHAAWLALAYTNGMAGTGSVRTM